MDNRGLPVHVFTFSCMADEAGNRVGGYAAAVTAFLYWGLVPVYWKLFTGVGAGEVIAHRVLWSLAFAAALVALRGSWREAVRALSGWGEARYLLLAAVLLAVNWLTFVWAVTHDRVADASLGYFLCPLVSVALALVALFRFGRRGDRSSPHPFCSRGAADPVERARISQLPCAHGVFVARPLSLRRTFWLGAGCRLWTHLGRAGGLFMDDFPRHPGLTVDGPCRSEHCGLHERILRFCRSAGTGLP